LGGELDRHAPEGARADRVNDDSVTRAGRDVLALGIGMAAIIMFVGTGGNLMPQVVRSLAGVGLPPDRLLSNALLLNIALIIFGLRRYRDLTDEVRERRRAETTARELAETDPLTGLLNRRSIAPATEALMNACAQSGEHVAFIMIDIDNFNRPSVRPDPERIVESALDGNAADRDVRIRDVSVRVELRMAIIPDRKDAVNARLRPIALASRRHALPGGWSGLLE